MGIDINKGAVNSSSNELTSNIIGEMSSSINDICAILSVESSVFDVKQAFNTVKEYVKNYDRLLYSNISTYCYNLDSQKTDNFLGNLNSLMEYVYSRNYNNGISAETGKGDTKEVELREKTKRIIIKLYDNVNLACAQFSTLRRSEEDLHQAFEREFEPAKEQITKDMSAQLITLVGIFTAIAFLVFGGLSTLTGVFSSLDYPLARLIMIISIWGLTLSNGVFILMSCIDALVRKSTFTALFRQNLIVQWTNLILLVVFFLSMLIYTIDNRNLGGWMIQFASSHPVIFALLALGAILGFFVWGLVSIHKNRRV